MKRLMCVLLSVVCIGVSIFAYSENVIALERINEFPDDFGNPISETSYVDEEGAFVTEKIYFVSDSNPMARGKSGSGWYKNEKTKEWEGGSKTIYYAQGYFVWGNGEVNVSNTSGGVTEVEGITISERKLSSGKGQYLWVFNNYAYVTFSFKATNFVGMGSDYSVTIRISESGNAI